MKKYSAFFILAQIVIVILISWLISMGFAFLALNENIPLSGLTRWMPLTLPVTAIIYFLCLSNPITGVIAKKTMKKHSEEQYFGKAETLINSGIGTVGTILRIDGRTGKVAYVSYQNPFKFQMAHAEELTNVVSGYIHGPFGTTRYVYFQFNYKGKRTRVPTFTSGNNTMVTSGLVKEGIAKADRLRDIVLRFQKTVV